MSAFLVDNSGYSKEQLDKAFETISCRGNDTMWRLTFGNDTNLYFRGFNVEDSYTDVPTDGEGLWVFLDGYYHGQSTHPQESLMEQLYGRSFEVTIKNLEGKFFLASYFEGDDLLSMGRCKWGMVPMYYHIHKNGRVTIASERKVFITLGIKWDDIQMMEAKKLYTLNTRTNVFKDNGAYYVIPEFKANNCSPEEHVANLKSIVTESVQLLTKDLKSPVASMLGGVDSSVVAMHLFQNYDKVNFYTSAVTSLTTEPVDLRRAKVFTQYLKQPLNALKIPYKTFELDNAELYDSVYTIESNNKYEILTSVLYRRLLRMARDNGIRVVFNGNFNDAANATADDLVREAERKGFPAGKYKGIQKVDSPEVFIYTNTEVTRLGMQDRAPFVYTPYIEYCYNIPTQFYDGMDKPFSRLVLSEWFDREFYSVKKGIPAFSAYISMIADKVDTQFKSDVFKELFIDVN